ncbi:methylthioribulose 1-phosphate dehydratase [Wenzhouxiangella marina]|uniref:Methylthioribulose-1-phosphate dehydratase n=1 Tax=Wenzhouxiangella marina TaxID=1579979 RepID=A0A0K0XS98_9GAMM|nr:methylthioribulose 1-phosphate dehydratase [Wenzhouxiangella marina]AKS40497.1 Methylthioribulose-1-phosphate dehydratase [Wenzhouxiangella marina]MBB6088181.1 methylthioribulose-1-phosphate dehydratase [Wenzhouxiangella marina]
MSRPRDLPEEPDPVSLRRIEALVAVARDFGQRGWTPATSGNYSVRLENGQIAVTRSGADKRWLEPADLLLLDADGQPEPGVRASAETPLHLQIYRHRPRVKAVLHVHSPAVTVASRLAVGEGRIRLHNYELLKALSGVDTHDIEISLPIVANDQDMSRLAASVEPLLAADNPCPAYLIEGHGIYAWGDDVADAARHLDALEFLLNCHLLERSA